MTHLKDAMLDELDYFNNVVWTAVPLEDAVKDTSGKIIGTRWVLRNKQDASEPDVRARLVAKDISTHHDGSFFTPPRPHWKQTASV